MSVCRILECTSFAECVRVGGRSDFADKVKGHCDVVIMMCPRVCMELLWISCSKTNVRPCPAVEQSCDMYNIYICLIAFKLSMMKEKRKKKEQISIFVDHLLKKD